MPEMVSIYGRLKVFHPAGKSFFPLFGFYSIKQIQYLEDSVNFVS